MKSYTWRRTEGVDTGQASLTAMADTSQDRTPESDRDAALTLALDAYRVGDFAAAAAACRARLEAGPGDALALHMLGLIAFAEGHAGEAVGHLVAAVAAAPESAEIRVNLALALRAQGNREGALEQYRHLLAQHPHDPDLLLGMAQVYLDGRSAAPALPLLDRALKAAPRRADLHALRGELLESLGDRAGARTAYLAALEIAPDDAAIRLALGTLLHRDGETEAALELLSNAAAALPGSAPAAFRLGLALADDGRLEEALLCFFQAADLDPVDPDAHNERGIALCRLGRPGEGAQAFRRALGQRPEDTDIRNNLAAALLESGEAEKALEAAERGLDLDPAQADLAYTKALALLTLGRLEEGWVAYERRWEQERFLRIDRPGVAPVWDGNVVPGLRLFLFAEQGYGDTLQFVRYAPRLAAQGVSVTVEVQPKLKDLVGSLAGERVRVIAQGDPIGPQDARCGLLGLPYRLGVAAQAPYLAVPDRAREKWGAALPPRSGFRIALSWRGSPDNPSDRRRSLPAATLAPLTAVDGLELFGLQYDVTGEERAALGPKVRHLGPDTDFSDAAAICEQMDLVVTVDTALAHLAGALGRPVWTLLAHACDWRWMRETAESPWYPSMRLFRQPEAGDWESVVGDIREALRGKGM